LWCKRELDGEGYGDENAGEDNNDEDYECDEY